MVTYPLDSQAMDPAFLMGGSSSEDSKPDGSGAENKKPEGSATMDPSFLSGGSDNGEKKAE